jgi:hypothetical protein
VFLTAALIELFVFNSCKRRERSYLADIPIDGDDIIKMQHTGWTGFNFLETPSKST